MLEGIHPIKVCVELHNAEADSVYLEAYVTVGLVT